MATLSSVNLFVRDLEGLVAFYAELLALPERIDVRSPIYRSLDAGGTAIGFNGYEAYSLLNLDNERATAGVKSLLTFEVADRAAVTRLADEAVGRGATIVKAPYDTAYGSRQSVLRDPEGNVFRINAFAP